MNDGFSSSQGDRGGVPNVMILVSDGDANINIGDTSTYRGGGGRGKRRGRHAEQHDPMSDSDLTFQYAYGVRLL